MRLSVVLSTHAAQFEAATFKGDLEDNVAKIAAWGYDGVELAVRDPQLVDGAAIRRLAERYDLATPAIGTGQAWGEERLSYTDPDPDVRAAAVARTLAHVPLAAETGAMVIVGLLRGVLQPGIEHAQAMEWTASALRQACETARPHGVRLALEPINRYETPLLNTAAESLELLERVGAPNLGLLLDTFHMNIEEPDIEASIRACGERIFHFHVADSNRYYPGAGHIDFVSVLDALFDTPYEGFVSGEFLPHPTAEEAAQEGIAYLRRIERPTWSR